MKKLPRVSAVSMSARFFYSTWLTLKKRFFADETRPFRKFYELRSPLDRKIRAEADGHERYYIAKVIPPL